MRYAMQRHMKTRHKIILVIVIFTGTYFVIHPGFIHLCVAFYDVSSFSSCPLIAIHNNASIHVMTPHAWDTGHGVGAWNGKGTEEPISFLDLLYHNLGFLIWFCLLPSFVIVGILIKDRCRKNTKS